MQHKYAYYSCTVKTGEIHDGINNVFMQAY